MSELSSPKQHHKLTVMPTPLPSPLSAAAVTDNDNDDYEDACSICLEPFTPHDPSNLTTCKHEYHLHCILEWSQRSKECPICWQSLALKDPTSQELLASVQTERNARQRRVSTNGRTYARPHQESGSEFGPHWTDDSDFNERIMRHLTTMMSRVREGHRIERHRSSQRSPSPVFMFGTRGSDSAVHPNTPEECSSAYVSSGGSSPTSSVSSVDPQPPLSPTPSAFDSPSGSAPRRGVPDRSMQSQSAGSTEKPRASELLALSDSFKSKLSAASARYKDSISKGTQGFKEKLLARRSTVKELGTGVQREMSAGISGVARMIERLDLKSKRKSDAGEAGEVLSRQGKTSNFFSKGKGVLDKIIADHDDKVIVDQGLDLHKASDATSSISGQKSLFCAERSR